jgi:DNA-binding response OmpR family regulator
LKKIATREQDVTRIMAIEEDRDISAFLTRLLRRAGYEVAAATTAVAGVALARNWRPDLILLDISHPILDASLPAFKEDDATAHTPIIMMTTAHYLDPDFARKHGYAAVVAKPFEIRHFLHLIDDCVAASRSARTISGT